MTLLTELDRLKKVAEKATPGPWVWINSTTLEYIAAFNPSTCLKLLRMLEKCMEQRDDEINLYGPEIRVEMKNIANKQLEHIWSEK